METIKVGAELREGFSQSGAHLENVAFRGLGEAKGEEGDCVIHLEQCLHYPGEGEAVTAHMVQACCLGIRHYQVKVEDMCTWIRAQLGLFGGLAGKGFGCWGGKGFTNRGRRGGGRGRGGGSKGRGVDLHGQKATLGGGRIHLHGRGVSLGGFEELCNIHRGWLFGCGRLGFNHDGASTKG